MEQLYIALTSTDPRRHGLDNELSPDVARGYLRRPVVSGQPVSWDVESPWPDVGYLALCRNPSPTPGELVVRSIPIGLLPDPSSTDTTRPLCARYGCDHDRGNTAEIARSVQHSWSRYEGRKRSVASSSIRRPKSVRRFRWSSAPALTSFGPTQPPTRRRKAAAGSRGGRPWTMRRSRAGRARPANRRLVDHAGYARRWAQRRDRPRPQPPMRFTDSPWVFRPSVLAGRGRPGPAVAGSLHPGRPSCWPPSTRSRLRTARPRRPMRVRRGRGW